MLNGSFISYIFLYVRDLAAARAFYERQLGFRVVEEDAAAVKYDAGGVLLALNRVSDFELSLSDSPDSLLVFYAPAIHPVVAGLRANAAGIGEVERYEIGAVAELRDADGHCFSVYEPSEELLGWPSGRKLGALLAWEADRRLPDRAAEPSATGQRLIGSCPLVYLFLFVRDVAEASAFYGGLLGLKLLERSPCSAGGPEDGVAKYDGGGLMLTTHYSDGLANKAVDLSRHKGLAVVFNVDDIERTTDELRTAGLTFGSGIIKSEIGKIISFSDPNGHAFYLYKASEAARASPSGSRIRQIADEYGR